ncbi:MAG: DegT/DnrJ/EryC1/StrS family aminotransferase, partial [Myxococcota bacterium]
MVRAARAVGVALDHAELAVEGAGIPRTAAVEAAVLGGELPRLVRTHAGERAADLRLVGARALGGEVDEVRRDPRGVRPVREHVVEDAPGGLRLVLVLEHAVDGLVHRAALGAAVLGLVALADRGLARVLLLLGLLADGGVRRVEALLEVGRRVERALHVLHARAAGAGALHLEAGDRGGFGVAALARQRVGEVPVGARDVAEAALLARGVGGELAGGLRRVDGLGVGRVRRHAVADVVELLLDGREVLGVDALERLVERVGVPVAAGLVDLVTEPVRVGAGGVPGEERLRDVKIRPVEVRQEPAARLLPAGLVLERGEVRRVERAEDLLDLRLVVAVPVHRVVELEASATGRVAPEVGEGDLLVGAVRVVVDEGPERALGGEELRPHLVLERGPAAAGEATERVVELVLVGADPLAGGVDLLRAPHEVGPHGGGRRVGRRAEALRHLRDVLLQLGPERRDLRAEVGAGGLLALIERGLGLLHAGFDLRREGVDPLPDDTVHRRAGGRDGLGGAGADALEVRRLLLAHGGGGGEVLRGDGVHLRERVGDGLLVGRPRGGERLFEATDEVLVEGAGFPGAGLEVGAERLEGDDLVLRDAVVHALEPLGARVEEVDGGGLRLGACLRRGGSRALGDPGGGRVDLPAGGGGALVDGPRSRSVGAVDRLGALRTLALDGLEPARLRVLELPVGLLDVLIHPGLDALRGGADLRLVRGELRARLGGVRGPAAPEVAHGLVHAAPGGLAARLVLRALEPGAGVRPDGVDDVGLPGGEGVRLLVGDALEARGLLVEHGAEVADVGGRQLREAAGDARRGRGEARLGGGYGLLEAGAAGRGRGLEPGEGAVARRGDRLPGALPCGRDVLAVGLPPGRRLSGELPEGLLHLLDPELPPGLERVAARPHVVRDARDLALDLLAVLRRGAAGLLLELGVDLLVGLPRAEVEPGRLLRRACGGRPGGTRATAEVIALLGGRPVYVDIDPRTFNIDVAAAAAA